MHGRGATGRRAALVAAMVAVYVVLAVAATWPLVPGARGTLTLGTEETSTVPAVSAWAMWWNADRVAAGGEAYWRAPIFAPAADSFALSEPMPLPGVVMAPLTWAGGPVLAANVWLLLALVLNGVAARALARRVGMGEGMAGAAGAAMVLLPFVHHELGVLALTGVFGMLWVLERVIAVDAAASAGTAGWKDGLWLGLAMAVTFLCCGQYAAFVGIAAGPPALVLWVLNWRERRRWVAAGVALAVVLVAGGPVLLGQRRAAAHHPMARSARRIADGAASTWAWSRSSGVEVLPWPGPAANPPGKRALFPGMLKLGLALTAAGSVVAGLRRRPRTETVANEAAGPPPIALSKRERERARVEGRPSVATHTPSTRRAIAFLLATGLLAFAWSTLPRAGNGWPIGSLLASTPGLAQIRSIWRIGVITQMVIVLLAFLQLSRWLPFDARSLRSRLLRAIGGVALVLMTVVELWPRAPRQAQAPDPQAWRPVVAWINEHVPANGVIAHLPMPANGEVASFARTGEWMLVGAWHHRPMVNGYSSSFPLAHDRLWSASQTFPDPRSNAALANAGVVALIIDDAWLDRDGRRARITAAGWRTALIAPAPGPGVTVFTR